MKKIFSILFFLFAFISFCEAKTPQILEPSSKIEAFEKMQKNVQSFEVADTDFLLVKNSVAVEAKVFRLSLFGTTPKKKRIAIPLPQVAIRKIQGTASGIPYRCIT